MSSTSDADTKKQQLVVAVVRKANNTRPVLRALSRRLWWSSLPDETAKEEGSAVWASQFVWKPLPQPLLAPPSDYRRRSPKVPQRQQVVNHLVSVVTHLTAKDRLWNTLRHHCQATPGCEFEDVMPETHVLAGVTGQPLEDWFGFEALKARVDAAPGALWLLKPPAMNRGQGIELCRDMEAMRTVIAPPRRRGPLVAETRRWIVQRYLEKPALIDGRKFDVRLWVLWTDDGLVRAYPQGYVRTSSEVYDVASTNKAAHLTNYAIQSKAAAGFGEHEAGNTLLFDEFDSHLTARFPEDDSKRCGPLMKEMLRIVKVSALACARRIVYADATAPPDWGSLGAKRSRPAVVRVPFHERLRQMRAEQAAKAAEKKEKEKEAEAEAEAEAGKSDTKKTGEGQGEAKDDGAPAAGVVAAAPTPDVGAGAGTSVGVKIPDPPTPLQLLRRAHVNRSRGQFELLGYDFMVSDDFKTVRLIEININPSTAYQNPRHEQLVDAMVEAVVRTTVDSVFHPPPEPVVAGSGDTKPAHPLPEEFLQDWTTVCDVFEEGAALHPPPTPEPTATPAPAAAAAGGTAPEAPSSA